MRGRTPSKQCCSSQSPKSAGPVFTFRGLFAWKKNALGEDLGFESNKKIGTGEIIKEWDQEKQVIYSNIWIYFVFNHWHKSY